MTRVLSDSLRVVGDEAVGVTKVKWKSEDRRSSVLPTVPRFTLCMWSECRSDDSRRLFWSSVVSKYNDT